jgi:hypothetical protein
MITGNNVKDSGLGLLKGTVSAFAWRVPREATRTSTRTVGVTPVLYLIMQHAMKTMAESGYITIYV